MNIDKIKNNPNMPKHIALIIDGNGRWAKSKGLTRMMGHKAGADNIASHIDFVSSLGIKNLSIFAFSTENWNRPKKEVDYLMELFANMFDTYADQFRSKDIRFIVSGDLDDKRVPDDVRIRANDLMHKTITNKGLVVNICLNYGGRQDMLRAVNLLIQDGQKELTIEDIDTHLYTWNMLPLDLIIRTSGEMRLSNFMLWQSAYSELCFYKKFWPAFTKHDLVKCIKDYLKRDRRFGGIKE